MKPALALFQPDIAGNTGSLMRTAACFGVALHVIEPAGFRFDDVALRRAGLDYTERSVLQRHRNWGSFRAMAADEARRVVLLTTAAHTTLDDFTFQPSDLLLLGRESAGVPEEVHRQADERVRIPIAEGMRSLNVAIAGSIALWQALAMTQAGKA